MTIVKNDASLQEAFNRGNANALPAAFQKIKLGDVLRALPTFLRKQVPVAGAAANGNLTTVDIIKLPDNAKASTVRRATVRAGGATGEFTAAVPDATPLTTQVGVTPCGDIAFLHAGDLVTDVDVDYQPARGEVVEFTGVPATGVLTLPTEWTDRGVLYLLEAEVLAGTTLGLKIILTPVAGAGLPATTKAQLTSNKTTVSFNNATDAPTSVRVKCLIATKDSEDLNALLPADQSIY